MSKISIALFLSFVLAALPVGAPKADDDPPEDNPGQPFQELADKIDGLSLKSDDLAQQLDGLETKLDDLASQVDLLQSGIDLIEAKLDMEVPSCPAVPNLQAAITKQIEQIDPPPGGGCAVLVELVTLSNQPFKPLADSILTPDHVSVLSGPTTTCTAVVGDNFKCRHQMLLQYPEGTSGSGDYELVLLYACDPDYPDCEFCGSEETIAFSLATTACPVLEG